jgi:uracil-DNA glycosylase
VKVLIVGQNPSRHNLDPKVAFKGSKSFKVIEDWASEIGLSTSEYILVNAFSKVNQKYNKLEVEVAVHRIVRYMSMVKPDKVIALGKIPAKVLKKAMVAHFELPHPSGLNRKLNDVEWLQGELEKARDYIFDVKMEVCDD